MARFLLLFLLCFGSLAAEYRVAATTDNVVIHTADGAFSGQAQFLAAVNQRIDALQMSTGVYLDGAADVFIVPDRDSYLELTAGKARIVEFSDAFYSSREGRIYLRSWDQIWENYADILIHEYTHWYLDRLFLSAPLWFHEGLATRFAGQMGPDRYLHFVRERFWGNKLDLFALAYQYPEQQRDWQMYYLSSYFAAKYMQDRDDRAWREFWGSVVADHRAGRQTRFVTAFGSAYRSSLYEFNRDFAAYTRKQAWIYLIIGVNSAIFAVLPFILLFAMLRHRRKLKALPELELPDEEAEPGEELPPDA